MNLANKITLLRVIMIPIYVVMMIMTNIPNNYLIAGIIFIIASISDFVDGQIARKCNMVTDFGKFVDPLADKLLVMAAMLCFVEINFIPAWIVITILAREFIVTGLRTLAASNGVVIAADKIGKLKTTTQMIALVLMHFSGLNETIYTVSIVLMYAALILTVVSGVNYLILNKNLFNVKE
ncbi:CDP-diacylglycerol--glycerol-3-phosphate 3-phosphatidyltransferase [Anaerofustis stercorihominis]|uniref:CDP-diacylglycerol--glycerol-3-phosphate 3-phosphatidyltransferase n=1 Tax=Anaerofustis stercorihominis TaxID=214853 RepID=UPI00214D0714|nr:CDP-diacylglycerol--glycerol-3-phosphate 3-phosphatidyltransferase [Anaerofustis stercorihominis]MCR2033204.1 CDP-diacylglycerol--glycerol-3-phosphate 3-phosphatidyltransferase [Anaerofustis stercorihominis]